MARLTMSNIIFLMIAVMATMVTAAAIPGSDTDATAQGVCEYLSTMKVDPASSLHVSCLFSQTPNPTPPN
jgi:hypothetical protein